MLFKHNSYVGRNGKRHTFGRNKRQRQLKLPRERQITEPNLPRRVLIFLLTSQGEDDSLV
jgi:hypothetical protein